MRYTISGKGLEVTSALREAVEQSLAKLEKYFSEETEANITLSCEKERQKVEITIPMKGNIVRTEQVSTDMYVSIDLAEEVIERQLMKYRKKLIEKHQDAEGFKKEFLESESFAEEDIEIIRVKKIGMKPMFPEDACLQMELLGHNFFVFMNADSEEVNVVYKRSDGRYGMIEPVTD